MKISCVYLLALAAVATSHPAKLSADIFNYKVDGNDIKHAHQQEGQTGKAVKGEYSWTAPNGLEYYVQYIADDKGFQIVDTNTLDIPRGFPQALNTVSKGAEVLFDKHSQAAEVHVDEHFQAAEVHFNERIMDIPQVSDVIPEAPEVQDYEYSDLATVDTKVIIDEHSQIYEIINDYDYFDVTTLHPEIHFDELPESNDLLSDIV